MKTITTFSFPQKRTEKIVFFSTLIWYLCISLYFSLYADFSYHHELMGYDSDFYIGLPTYPSIFYHVTIIFLLLFALWGVVKSNILRNISLSFFAYNLIIHFVCGYGNNELQLFCGHWLFFVPIFIAIGLDAVTQKSLRRVIQIMMIACAIFFAIHNGYCYITSIQACSI